METYEKFREFIKRHVYLLLGGACLLVVGIIYLVQAGTPTVNVNENIVAFVPAEDRAQEPEYLPAPAAVPTPEPEPSEIMVHIVGAVYNPGVFVLLEGARINDVLTLAGGATANADLRRINLAALAVDAMQIIVPYYGEEVGEVFVYASPQAPAQASGQTASGLININTASNAELQTLPGIGPVLAEAIINFRETHGRFQSVEELINVPRIGPATLERLRPLVEVG